MTTAADTATSERRDTLAREYLGKLLERHRLGASENDIRAAFRDFLLRTGIAADEGEIVTEYPRRLFFVTAHPNEGRFALPNTFITSPRTGSLDKKTYSADELDGHLVNGDSIFSVYLGESQAPYVTLPPLTATLPVSKATMEMPLDHSDCEVLSGGFIRHNACEVDQQELDDRMRARWEKMERL